MKIFLKIIFLISLLAAPAVYALGDDTAVMTITLHRLDNNDTTTQIFWETDGLALGGVTKWSAADAYIKIESTVTGGGGIQIYTNNGPSMPGGLVADDNLSGMPLCWRIWGGLLTAPDLVIQQSSDWHLQNNGWSCFMWVKDKNEPDFNNGDTYITAINGSGLHVEDYAPFVNWWGPANFTYLYLGADFSGASAERKYKTTALTLEAYIQ